MRAKVYVTPKPGVLDPAGKAIERRCTRSASPRRTTCGWGSTSRCGSTANADQATGRLDDMCRKLLANGVIEDYRFEIGE